MLFQKPKPLSHVTFNFGRLISSNEASTTHKSASAKITEVRGSIRWVRVENLFYQRASRVRTLYYAIKVHILGKPCSTLFVTRRHFVRFRRNWKIFQRSTIAVKNGGRTIVAVGKGILKVRSTQSRWKKIPQKLRRRRKNCSAVKLTSSNLQLISIPATPNTNGSSASYLEIASICLE